MTRPESSYRLVLWESGPRPLFCPFFSTVGFAQCQHWSRCPPLFTKSSVPPKGPCPCYPRFWTSISFPEYVSFVVHTPTTPRSDGSDLLRRPYHPSRDSVFKCTDSGRSGGRSLGKTWVNRVSSHRSKRFD